VNNDPVPDNDSTKAKREQLKQLAEGSYETAQYMLFHNKKR